MSPRPGSRGALRARSEASVEELLAAARDAFGAEGFEATTLDVIAERAGRTKGAIYHHFPTKLALFESVFVAEQRRLVELCARAGAAADGGVGALEAGLAAYLDAVADPVTGRITLVDGPAALGWARWRTCDEGSFRSLLEAALERLDAEGLLADQDVGILTDLLLGAVTELALGIAHADQPAALVGPYAEQLRRLVGRVAGV